MSPRRNLRARRVPIAIAIVASVVGAFAIGSIAAAELQDRRNEPPANVSSSPSGAAAVGQKMTYARNSGGQTYGAWDQAVAIEDLPDLVSAIATNGRTGYISRLEFAEITGGNVANPEEAIEWQARIASESWVSKSIPVFEVDGKTVIGQFEISKSTPIPSR